MLENLAGDTALRRDGRELSGLPGLVTWWRLEGLVLTESPLKVCLVKARKLR